LCKAATAKQSFPAIDEDFSLTVTKNFVNIDFMRNHTFGRNNGVFALLLMIPLTVYSQIAARSAFEVATVKENPAPDTATSRYIVCHGTDSGDPQIPLGRCISRGLPLGWVVAEAFDISVSQAGQLIVGKFPVLSEIYDIEGKAENPVPRAELRLMLQSLLAERFKLAVHREKKEVPTFALVVAKNGPKLTPVLVDKDCVTSTTLGPCHGFMGGRGRGLHGQSVSMKDLAVNLTNWAGSIVIDNTALPGLFNIQTTPWVPDNPGPNFAAEAGTDPANLPTLFTMLQEQLGLRLEARKETVEVLVIDHIEKPSR
jgi:uncharacterized protein (TIGR03435 family)